MRPEPEGNCLVVIARVQPLKNVTVFLFHATTIAFGMVALSITQRLSQKRLGLSVLSRTLSP